jgi:hypothetical protein
MSKPTHRILFTLLSTTLALAATACPEPPPALEDPGAYLAPPPPVTHRPPRIWHK